MTRVISNWLMASTLSQKEMPNDIQKCLQKLSENLCIQHIAIAKTLNCPHNRRLRLYILYIHKTQACAGVKPIQTSRLVNRPSQHRVYI